ncbi:MAG: Gfo/Idh/MocA family oxidoreductase [Verrucomicrobiota bacterium]
MSRLSRRDFLKGAAAITAACAIAPRIKAIGANSDIRVAVVGVRGMGKSHVRNYLKMPGVRLVALCDADLAILNAEVRQLDKSGVKVAAYQNIRKLFESKEVDAISIVTPDHWHALATVWGCQAGKDIDVEKPVSHNIWEGLRMVEAARKYHRIVQADLDARSRTTYDEAFEYLQSGALGRIVLGRGFCYKLRPSIGLAQGTGVIPKSVDYDLWCGPASNGPLKRINLHYDWHWVWDTGGGELAGNGVHQLDAIRWMFKESGLPRRVMSLGGRLGYQDDGQTPNIQITFFDYPTAPIIYETRALPSSPGAKLMDVYDALAATGVRINS